MLVSDVNVLPINSNSLDYIICFGVFQYIYNAENVIKEFSRVIKKGGRVLINVPNKKFFMKRSEHFYNWYDPEDIGVTSIQHGFTHYQFINLFLMPVYLRWLERFFDKNIFNKNFPWLAHDLIILLTK